MMKSVMVWDPVVRVFHWATAVLFVANFAVFDDDSVLHIYVGYVLFALVLVRLVWGIVGTRYARFNAFWPSFIQIKQHIGGMFRGDAEQHLSHNPLGALMVCNLLCALFLIGITGIMMSDGGFSNADWVEDAHEFLSNYAMICVGLHILGVLIETRRGGVNLIRAMITGVKSAPAKSSE